SPPPSPQLQAFRPGCRARSPRGARDCRSRCGHSSRSPTAPHRSHGFLSVHVDGSRGGGSEDEHDHAERCNGRDFIPRCSQHLEADEYEYEREPDGEIAQLADHARQQEVQRSQPEYRGDVRGINEKRHARHRKNRRYAVDRENQIHRLDQNQHDEQRRRHSAFDSAFFLAYLNEEMFALIFVIDGNQAANQPEYRIAAGIDVLLATHAHPYAGDDKEQTEHIRDPGKPAEKSGAGGDHQSPHDERAEYAPEQHSMLILLLDIEIGEDQHHHKYVVNRERVFHEVARDELDTGQAALEVEDSSREEERQDNPYGAANRGFLYRKLAASAEEAKVDGESDEHDRVERDPRGQRRVDHLRPHPSAPISAPLRRARRAGSRSRAALCGTQNRGWPSAT